MYSKKEYLEDCASKEAWYKRVNSDAHRLNYHLMAPTGWLNDPNGLHQSKGVNHIYFQYTPFNAGWGIKSWGHYSTEDWITYTLEEPFIFPDTAMDRDGAYSGSALVEGDEIHFFYTGNVKLDGDYDYITAGREQNTIHLVSHDSLTFSNKELVLANSDYPKDLSTHVRDPKVLKQGDRYLMILGARNLESQGEVLIYQSDDLKHWQYKNRLTTSEKFGFMWECPDLFAINGHHFLTLCPQGLKAQKTKYQNIFQDGYFKLDSFNEQTTLEDFEEFDYGFDFYAAQTFEDEKGRRILLAWMGLPMESNYHEDPTVAYGWRHALTMPRELVVKNNRLYQLPLEEFKKLRNNSLHESLDTFEQWDSEDSCFEMLVDFEQETREFKLQLRDDVFLKFDGSYLILEMGPSGYGRKKRYLSIKEISQLQIFSDTSSLEIFINKGEYTMTTRVFSVNLNQTVSLETSSHGEVTIFKLDSFHLDNKK